MKQKIKYAVEHGIQNALQLFRLLPLKNQVNFIAFSGRQYSDSPRRISEELLKTHPEIQQIWAFNEPEKFRFLEEKGIKVVKYKSLEYLYYVMTSRVYVDNAEFWSILKFRPEQMVLETWHGGGAYKRVGGHRIDVNAREQQHAVEKMNKITLFLSSSKAFTKYVIRDAYQYRGEVLECGLPRNDELLDPAPATEIREKLGIPEHAKVLLYAPTFRKSHTLDLYDVDFARLKASLESRFGGEWIILLRMHYYLSDRVSSIDLPFVRDVTSYPDMQELLIASDVLLTDYSSCMWDFSLMHRPCFLYARDIAAYRGERDFYTPIESWPFPLASDNDELASVIADFDENTYCAAVDRHHADLGSTESGTAAKQCAERIAAFLK
ncbi:MAG: CDP-glycerol glycerophosphotransferase family protein [Oscillospiraceae bacterium]|nr:CDP-glycerol glycerophosphotransferase family protein [Oscillospiraceae bacterium]